MNITEEDRIRRSKQMKRCNDRIRGKSYEEVFGEEKAKKWKESLSKSRKGVVKSKEWVNKIKSSLKGRRCRPLDYRHSKDTIDKISLSQKSRNDWPKGNKHCRYISIDKKILNDLYWCKNLSMSIIAKQLNTTISVVNNRMKEYGIPKRSHSDKTRVAYLEGRKKNSGWPHTIKAKKYKNCRLKSSWEFKVAMFLDNNNINWEYEPISIKYKANDGKFHSYFPDFYLQDFDTFIEVKGRYFENDMLKLVALKKKSRVIVVDRNSINNLEEVLSIFY